MWMKIWVLSIISQKVLKQQASKFLSSGYKLFPLWLNREPLMMSWCLGIQCSENLCLNVPNPKCKLLCHKQHGGWLWMEISRWNLLRFPSIYREYVNGCFVIWDCYAGGIWVEDFNFISMPVSYSWLHDIRRKNWSPIKKCMFGWQYIFTSVTMRFMMYCYCLSLICYCIAILHASWGWLQYPHRMCSTNWSDLADRSDNSARWAASAVRWSRKSP